jgi:hypothetical protein
MQNDLKNIMALVLELLETKYFYPRFQAGKGSILSKRGSGEIRKNVFFILVLAVTKIRVFWGVKKCFLGILLPFLGFLVALFAIFAFVRLQSSRPKALNPPPSRLY